MHYIICFYWNGTLVHEVERANRAAAELIGLEGLREGCEVTIYKNGKALAAWNRRVS